MVSAQLLLRRLLHRRREHPPKWRGSAERNLPSKIKPRKRVRVIITCISLHPPVGVPQSLVAARRVWSSDHTCTPVPRGSTKGLEFRPYLHPSPSWQHKGSGVQTIPAAQVYKCLQSAFVMSSSHSPLSAWSDESCKPNVACWTTARPRTTAVQ